MRLSPTPIYGTIRTHRERESWPQHRLPMPPSAPLSNTARFYRSSPVQVPCPITCPHWRHRNRQSYPTMHGAVVETTNLSLHTRPFLPGQTSCAITPPSYGHCLITSTCGAPSRARIDIAHCIYPWHTFPNKPAQHHSISNSGSQMASSRHYSTNSPVNTPFWYSSLMQIPS